MSDSHIEVGPPLDAAVCRACGIEFIQLAMNGKSCFTAVRGKQIIDPYREFCPSTRADDAFEAAEKVGLFDTWSLEKNAELNRWSFGRVWFRYDEDLVDDDEDRQGWNYDSLDGIGDGCPTPAEAICRAILALKQPATANHSQEA